MSLPAYPLELDGGARLLAAWFDYCEPDAQEIHQLLAPGALISDRSSSGATLLHIAAKNSWPQPAIDALLAYGPDLEARDDEGATPLLRAALEGHAGVARQLIRAGASMEVADKYGRAPLHAAACSGQADLCALLIESGAPVDARDNQGASALHAAALYGRTTVVQLLIGAGANIEAVESRQGGTALFHAARQWKGASGGYYECVQVLVAAGANLDAVDIRGSTVLDQARQNGGSVLEFLESAHTERYLEKAFAQPHTPDGQALGERLFGPADTSAQPVRTRRAGLRL